MDMITYIIHAGIKVVLVKGVSVVKDCMDGGAKIASKR